ncbi:protein mono-ADP-ribosyltransferase PARP14-like isoform X2 [Physella acuta]|uniref:protein mono-ADP-ribosyltransferase PARP14-like isoform X2 n=1 Tax=Physella acuta TaxID=109671 RepID=UPI0027DDB2F0|nr:protein mono-ADP-ribosyltransferase PARP14-like isoform X2 [Physella acuta]
MTACIQLDQAEENLVNISPQEKQYKLHKNVEEFLFKEKQVRQNRKEVAFPFGKQQMLERFMQNDHDKILNDKTAKVEKLADRFIVTGLMDSVYKLTEQLQELSLKITVQDIELKYFGIQEFLQNAEGKSLVKKVEDQNQCVILIKSEDVKATFGSPKTETKQVEPSVIARAEVYNVELVFLQGDITTIKADVIVNPLDSSLATSSALSRSLISRGPADLFKNLKQLSKGSLGTVIPTTCSKIPNLKAIFNVVCPVSIDDLDKLRLAVTNCLMECQKQNFSSIALPVIGIGQKFPIFTTCIRMMDALYDYLNGSPTLTHIYFCDVQPNHVEELMDRFEAKFDQCTLHHVSKSDEEKNITKHGAVTLVIEKGDITLEKCDGVVIGIKDSMDLNHSGQVCKALLKLCGQTLQDECFYKQSEMAQDGVVLTSAPNMSCQHILHVSQDKFAKHWDKGVTAVLAEADKAGLKSLAIPALGTGARNANIPLLSKMILGAIEDFGKSLPRSLTQIKLVIYDQYVLDEFLDQAQSKHLSHNIEGSGTTTKVSEQVTLECYSNHPYQIRMAKQSLLQECKASFKENSVRDENVKKLNTKQIEKLKSVGFENLVLVTVRQEAGIVLMQGFKVDGIVKVQKLLQKFLSIYVVHEELHKSLLSAIEGEEWDDFELILTSKLKHKVKAGVESLPDQWTPMSTEESVKTVPLNHGCCEYNEIKQLFILGGANLPIKKIERIQNKFLYQQYSVKKRELDLVNPKGHKNELRLFHGTSAQSIPMIIHNGFNRSYCGMNGTVYGKGVYFAVNSSYSVSYAKPDAQGNRHMFVALVLVGESTPSNASMNYLPIKPGTTRPYDSGCANGMYVIFHDTQCYPQYLITF